MSTALSDNDKAFIREYVAAADSDEEKRARREECAADFKVSISVIRAVTAWTKIYADKAKNALTEPVMTDTSATREPGDDMHALPAENQPVLPDDEGGGEHVNYDNDIKRKWRQKWREFLENHTTEQQRKLMRVLCLPGKKCLEIPLYLELGFMPENIIGVEGGDKAAREEFADNAARYGIDGRIGRMQKIAAAEKTPFDVVSLDFHGMMSKANMIIAQNILVNRRSIVMTNFLAKRERKDVQEVFTIADSMIDIDVKLFGEYGANLIDHLHQEAKEQYRNGESVLPETRSRASALNYISMIGTKRTENFIVEDLIDTFPVLKAMEKESESEHANNVKATIDLIVQAACETLARLLSDHGIGRHEAGRQTFLANALASHAYYGAPFPMQMGSYRYLSESGKGGAPFESDFFVMNKPTDKYEEARRTPLFLLHAAKGIVDVLNEKESAMPSMYVRDKHNMRLDNIRPLKNSDTVVMDNASGETIASLDVRRFYQDLKTYMSAYAGNIVDKIAKKEADIIRHNIT